MLGTVKDRVKPPQAELLDPAGNRWARLGVKSPTDDRVTAVLLIIIVAAVVASAAAFRRKTSRREQAVRDLLDSADALEARLRTARAEIEAVAGDEDNPVQEALREMLRQRLWLQQHGDTASLGELEVVRQSIDRARVRIDDQLARIERARAPAA